MKRYGRDDALAWIARHETRRSQRVLEKAGFAREGRLAVYLAVPEGRADALIYACTAG